MLALRLAVVHVLEVAPPANDSLGLAPLKPAARKRNSSQRLEARALEAVRLDEAAHALACSSEQMARALGVTIRVAQGLRKNRKPLNTGDVRLLAKRAATRKLALAYLAGLVADVEQAA